MLSLLPCQHSCSAESWSGEWIQLKSNIAKTDILGVIVCFPVSFYPTLLSRSFVALHRDMAGTNTWEGVKAKDWEAIVYADGAAKENLSRNHSLRCKASE